jgi:hypothetical protein
MQYSRRLIVGGRRGGLGVEIRWTGREDEDDFGDQVSDQLVLVCLNELQKHPLRWPYVHVDALGLELLHPDSDGIFRHKGLV